MRKNDLTGYKNSVRKGIIAYSILEKGIKEVKNISIFRQAGIQGIFIFLRN